MNGNASQLTAEDELNIRFVAAAAEDAWAAMNKVALDEKFTPQHKMQTITEEFAQALTTTQERVAYHIEGYDTDSAKLKKQAYVSPAPPPDQIPQLLYVRDTILTEYADNMNQGQLAIWWRGLLDNGDLITAKAAKDFLPAMLKARQKGTGTNVENLYSPGLFAPLIADTEDALLPAEKREALAKLKAIQAKRTALTIAAGKVSERLKPGHWEIFRGELRERFPGMPVL